MRPAGGTLQVQGHPSTKTLATRAAVFLAHGHRFSVCLGPGLSDGTRPKLQCSLFCNAFLALLREIVHVFFFNSVKTKFLRSSLLLSHLAAKLGMLGQGNKDFALFRQEQLPLQRRLLCA